MDRVLDQLKLYVFSVMDVHGKFAFSLPYRHKTSRNAVDFWEKFQQVYPVPIRGVQTDNGPEFLGEFEAYLEGKQIPQSFIYPRCPKVNGCTERHQRSLSEEFLQVHEFSVRQPRQFHLHLADYLVFYNCKARTKHSGYKRRWGISSPRAQCLKCP